MCRQAEARIRELAEKATPGPWVSLDNGDRLTHEHNDGTDDFTYVVDEPMSNGANAEHIAAWHPIVALAVADVLANAAVLLDALPDDVTMPSSLSLTVRLAEAFGGES